MSSYKLSKKASQKIQSIYEYSLLNFGEEKADEYFLSMHKTFRLLAEQPYLGRQFKEFYKHEHGHHTFFYKIKDYGIIILHIFHQKEELSINLQ